MTENVDYRVIELLRLAWPADCEIPSRRFRLLVAGDSSDATVDEISKFATAALSRGMVYLVAWGPGCERLHDVFDQVKIEDELGARKFVGPNPNDVIMTTWHDEETLTQALDFLATCAVPSDGFTPDSHFV